MKKYRVTSAHKTMKEGLILEWDPLKNLYIFKDGEASAQASESVIKEFPTWYEEVKPERWRTQKNCVYFYVASTGESVFSSEDNSWIDDYNFRHGNYFQTKEQAEEAAKRVRECLLAYQEEITK